MPFEKGNKHGHRFNSDNQPEEKGRKPKLPELDILLDKVLGKQVENKDYTVAEAIIMKVADQAEKGNNRAQEIILNRAYGKPVQPVYGSFTGTINLIFDAEDGEIGNDQSEPENQE